MERARNGLFSEFRWDSPEAGTGGGWEGPDGLQGRREGGRGVGGARAAERAGLRAGPGPGRGLQGPRDPEPGRGRKRRVVGECVGCGR